MSAKAWIIFVGVCLIAFGGLVFLSSKDRLDVSTVNVNDVLAASADNGNVGDRVFGNKDSKVILIEYGDFQCPGCGSAHPVIKPLLEKYKDQLGFVFRNFPLTQIHPNAMTAAASAEAAGLQGKYWEMHDKIYETQSAWQNLQANKRIDFFAGYAKNLGLDEAKFRSDLAGSEVAKKIAFDQAVGKKAKVTSTPTFFINGKPIDQYVKDGKIVPSSTSGSNPIWSDSESFEKLIIIPALKENNIALPEATATAE